MGIMKREYNRFWGFFSKTSNLAAAASAAATTQYVALTLGKTYGDFNKVTQTPFFYLTE